MMRMVYDCDIWLWCMMIMFYNDFADGDDDNVWLYWHGCDVWEWCMIAMCDDDVWLWSITVMYDDDD